MPETCAFCGTGTTMIAALRHQRNSIGVEIDPDYCRIAASHLKVEINDLFNKMELVFEKVYPENQTLMVQEDPALYKVRPAGRKRG